MGGVFGFVCREKVSGLVLYEGLRRLSYRGNDGCGIAFMLDPHTIVVRKKASSIDKSSDYLGFKEFSSEIAVGNVWHAIRGAPVDVNAQPHQDCRGDVYVVSDGLIRNYEDLRKRLRRLEHVFKSTTDIEVLAHMLENELRSGREVLEALRAVALEASGMYTAIFMIRGAPLLGFITRDQQIVLGISDRCFYLSSDIPSLYGLAEEAIVIDEDSVGVVTMNGYRVVRLESGEELKTFTRKTLKKTLEFPEKGEFPHFMLKEIYEIPEALKRTTLSLMEKYLRLAAMIIANARGVLIIGSGSSYHAGLVGQYYLSRLAQINSVVVNASEFPYYAIDSISTGTVVIAISQSGETADVIKSVKLAKSRGAVIIGVTNTLGSRLTLHSNVYLPIGAGPELAIPATKTFASTLASLLILASHVGLYRGLLSESEVRGVYSEIESLSENLKNRMGEVESQAGAASAILSDSPIVYVVGSGILYPIALEGVLKLKEASLTHATGLQLGELRHGHIAVLSEGVPVIVLEPVEEDALELYEKLVAMLRDRGATVFRVGRKGDITVPYSGLLTAPIAYSVPLQLLAYKLGVAKKAPIDSPPGLAKAVTT